MTQTLRAEWSEAEARYGALNNLATTLQKLTRHEATVAAFERLAKRVPAHGYMRGDCFHARRWGWDWREFNVYAGAIGQSVANRQRSDRPFSFLSVSDSAAGQLDCAAVQSECVAARRSGVPLWRGERYGHDRIRIAYVSPDFRDDAVMRLLIDTLDRHDRTCFGLHGVSLNADHYGGPPFGRNGASMSSRMSRRVL